MSHPVTAAESASELYIDDYWPPGDLRRYGGYQSGARSSAAALESAIRQWYRGGAPLYAPSGRWLIDQKVSAQTFDDATFTQGPGLTTMVDLQTVAFENNRGLHVYCTGVDNFKARSVNLYSNDQHLARYGMRFDGAAATIRNNGVERLELSTVAHHTDPESGEAVREDDGTKLYVGSCVTDAAGRFSSVTDASAA